MQTTSFPPSYSFAPFVTTYLHLIVKQHPFPVKHYFWEFVIFFPYFSRFCDTFYPLLQSLFFSPAQHFVYVLFYFGATSTRCCVGIFPGFFYGIFSGNIFLRRIPSPRKQPVMRAEIPARKKAPLRRVTMTQRGFYCRFRYLFFSPAFRLLSFILSGCVFLRRFRRLYELALRLGRRRFNSPAEEMPPDKQPDSQTYEQYRYDL